MAANSRQFKANIWIRLALNKKPPFVKGRFGGNVNVSGGKQPTIQA